MGDKIKIAIDVPVGRKRRDKLIRMGYDVVCEAKPKETDDSWLNRAFVNGAIFAVSADSDVPRLIERNLYPMTWILYPLDFGIPQSEMVSHVDKAIKHKIRMFNNLSTRRQSWFGHFLSSIKLNIF